MSGTKPMLDGSLDLEKRPNSPILLVQGELAYKAGRKLAGKHYVIVSLPDERETYGEIDWSAIQGRNVLIWFYANPNDKALSEAVAEELCQKHECLEVKILRVAPGDMWKNELIWDVYAAVQAGMTWPDLLKWARPRAKVWGQVITPDIVDSPDEEPSLQERVVDMDQAEEALEVIDAPMASTEDEKVWEALGLARSRTGLPIANIDNALRVLERTESFKGLLWYDEFHMRVFTRTAEGKPREWEDIDDLRMTTYMQRDLCLSRMGLDNVAQAVKLFAHKDIRNEPKDWMSGLKWDKVERIPHFFFVCFGTPNNKYSRAASRNFWVGMAARIFRPGCQLDNMVVLEGYQGVGKTRALRAIGGPWYVEANESVQSKDFYMILRGKLLIEIAELDAFNRAEVTRIKQVITCNTDSYRAPYERRSKDHPRQCVFVGSTNEDAYLRDSTGARRFWPIRCQQIDVPKIHELREQLYAEAAHAYKAGESWHIMPDEETAKEQEARRQHDEWESIIFDYLEGRDIVEMREIWKEAFQGDLSRMDKSAQFRIAHSLRALGWTRRDKRINLRKCKYWIRKGSDMFQSDEES